jgi:hypothetical protein
MTECKHEWDDERPTFSDRIAPPPDNNIVVCKKCGAPLQLARRTGMWKGTETPGIMGAGPPWHYLGKK